MLVRFRWHAVHLALVSVIAALFAMVVGCHKEGAGNSGSDTQREPRTGATPSSPDVRSEVPQAPPVRTLPELSRAPGRRADNRIQFIDRAAQSGIDFVHYAPISREAHIHLYLGSGVAWCDYDRDGWPDLQINQGAPYPPAPNAPRQSNRFFRNFDGKFTDVTSLAGLTDDEYSLGVAAADYDNDGFPDLYVTNFGRNCLYRNNGDGTFDEVGRLAGVDTNGLPASCAWADVDNDGLLDLYVCYYVDIDPARPDQYPVCVAKQNSRGNDIVVKPGQDDVKYVTCHPRYQKAAFDVLLHNLGDGRFSDISTAAGLHGVSPGPALGVVAADLDDDGRVDFFVANDSVQNHLWHNQGGLKFQEIAVSSGTAVNRDGHPQACMGIAIGDIEGEGLLDLLVTNYFRESCTFYRNVGVARRGGLQFQDVTSEMGLAGPTRLRLGFGTNFIDPDNDGRLDLFIANGHVDDRLEETSHRPEEPFRQLAQLFENDNGRRFRDISEQSGPYFRTPLVGRGSAAADYDRDGRNDLAVQNLNLPLTLLHNETPAAGAHLSIELIGVKSNRDGVGAKLFCFNESRRLLRPRLAGNSYLSCDEERILIGLGTKKTVDRILVRWPTGLLESWNDLRAGTHYRLVEGSGQSKLSDSRK